MSSVISSEPIQMRRVWSMLMTRASAFSCSGVHTRVSRRVAADGAGATDEKPDDEKRGKSGWPCRRNSSMATASGILSRTASSMICINLANGNSNGMVANSASLSDEAASGGVMVPLELATRVHLPSAE